MWTIGRTGSEAHSTDAAEISTVNRNHTQSWDDGTCAFRAYTFVEWASEPVLRRIYLSSNQKRNFLTIDRIIQQESILSGY